MKRLTILDEDFIAVEGNASSAILNATSLINKLTSPIMDIACNNGEDIRTCPSYIEIRGTVNPVESVTQIVNRLVRAIMERKRNYRLEDVAIMSEIYNSITHMNDVNKFSALEQACCLFGPVGNFTFHNESNTVDLNDIGVSEFVRKLSALREAAVQALSTLSNAANMNNIQQTTEQLRIIVLLKEFINHL